MKTAVCIFVLNEERRIAEWLAYHFAVGFETIIAYNNASTDRTQRILSTFSARTDTRLIDWPCSLPYSQRAAYENCLLRFGHEFDWIAFIDADEFIVCDTLVAVLCGVPRETTALGLNWRVFGSNGRSEPVRGELVIETFTRRAPDTWGPNRHVKSIVRPSGVKCIVNPHAFPLSEGIYAHPSGVPIKWLAPAVTGPDHRVACVHHYFVRSRQEWEEKMQRGYRNATTD
jgi:glycosyltransferase involved in cell wall biosynthesis